MQPSSSPRSDWRAGLLSLLVPGLGHLYAGHPKRGAFYFCASVVVADAVAAAARFDALSAMTYTIAAATLVVVRAAAIVDSVRLARRADSTYELRSFNRWYKYAAVVVVSSILVSPLHLAVRTYRIVSGGMMPTLLIGDGVITNVSIDARTNPARGDVVVFQYPRNTADVSISRIIGLPRETIAVHERRVVVNGREIVDPWGFCPDGQPVGVRAADCEPPLARLDEMAPVTLGADEYFLLGDNREHSQDSRLLGAVPGANILAKVLGVYWSKDHDRHRPRLDRIGLSLEPG